MKFFNYFFYYKFWKIFYRFWNEPMQTASGYTLYYTPVPCLYAFAPCLCMHTPVVYSGIMAFTLYLYDAPNKLFKDKKKGWAKASACSFHICLFCANNLLFLSLTHLSSSRPYRSVRFPGSDSQCPSVILCSTDVPCPVKLLSSITSMTFVFSLTQIFVFLSWDVMFQIFVLVYFVWLLACLCLF